VTSRCFQERQSRRAKRAGDSGVTLLGERRENPYFRLLSTLNEKINLTALDLTDLGQIRWMTPHRAAPMVAAQHVPATVGVDDGCRQRAEVLPRYDGLAISLGRVCWMVEFKRRVSQCSPRGRSSVGLIIRLTLHGPVPGAPHAA
jgi:hypothetical protein